MTHISSHANPRIKELRSLRLKKRRDESGSYLVEGIRHVGEAIEGGAAVQGIYFAPELLESPYALDLIHQQDQLGIPCFSLSKEIFLTLAEKENPQGILAQVLKKEPLLEDLTADNFGWGVAVVSPQDPGNLGAILRTTEAVGAMGVLILEGGVDAYHPSAVRASMGTLFRLKVAAVTFEAFASWSARLGFHVYGSSAHAELDYRQVRDYHWPRILLLGNEREGLTPEQASVCENVVRIPMAGKATSLNLAVAAGVLLYAMLEGQAVTGIAVPSKYGTEPSHGSP